MVQVLNYTVAIPDDTDRAISMPRVSGTVVRDAYTTSQFGTDITQLSLPAAPSCTEIVEVYINGRRLLNPRTRSIGGTGQFEAYNCVGSVLIFSTPVSGNIVAVFDRGPADPRSMIIPVDNVQGIERGTHSQWTEPVALHQPFHGYVRPSTDRRSLAYMPDANFTGNDVFSFCLINIRGQTSRNYCVNITVV